MSTTHPTSHPSTTEHQEHTRMSDLTNTLATIVGNQIVRFASRYCGRRTTLLLAAGAV